MKYAPQTTTTTKQEKITQTKAIEDIHVLNSPIKEELFIAWLNFPLLIPFITQNLLFDTKLGHVKRYYMIEIDVVFYINTINTYKPLSVMYYCVLNIYEFLYLLNINLKTALKSWSRVAISFLFDMSRT